MFKKINYLNANAPFILYVTLNYLTLFFTPLPLAIWVSFFLNLNILIIALYYHLYKEKEFSPAITTSIIFFTLFFFISPIVQISSAIETTGKFNNYLPFKHDLVVKGNGLILVFMSVLYLSYFSFKTKRKNLVKNSFSNVKRLMPLTLLFLSTISIIVVLSNIEFIMTELESSNYSKSSGFDFKALIIKKFIFFIPLGGLILLLNYLKTTKSAYVNKIIMYLFFVTIFIIVLLLKNPLLEKRNALGPIYFMVVYLLAPAVLNKNKKLFLLLFLVMILVYPVISVFTHTQADLSEIINNPDEFMVFFQEIGSIQQAFNSLHYDAYINLLATIDYVSTEGFQFGSQLLGTLLFFIPRAFWTNKPTSTGEFIGDYLINKYDFFFNNLSSPIVSEGFIDFGLMGVIIYAVALSFFMRKSTLWLHSADPLKNAAAFYFSLHLMFLIRGDLLNGIAYFLGPFLAFYVLPKLVLFIFKK